MQGSGDAVPRRWWIINCHVTHDIISDHVCIATELQSVYAWLKWLLHYAKIDLAYLKIGNCHKDFLLAVLINSSLKSLFESLTFSSKNSPGLSHSTAHLSVNSLTAGWLLDSHWLAFYFTKSMEIYYYHIVQNSGGIKLWWISDFKVLARKTLANAQHLYYWQENNFGESAGELSFVRQKPIY